MEGKSIPNGRHSFLKLLKEDYFRKEIRIPHLFASKLANKLSRICELQGNEEDTSWIVKISRKGHSYYICKAEWSDFVKFYDLKYGDYLLFFLIDQATFKVIPYGADCCQKTKISDYAELHPSTTSDSSDYDDSSSGEESEEDLDTGMFTKQPAARHGANKRHRSHYRVELSPERKEHRKKHRGDSRAPENVKKHRIDIRAGSSNRFKDLKKSRNSGNSPGTLLDLNAEDPFHITLRGHNTAYMTIPRAFARGTQIEEKENVVLRGNDKREWDVEIRHRGGRVDMVKGWPDFYKGYDLREGDICKFTQLKALENVLLVEINRKMHD